MALMSHPRMETSLLSAARDLSRDAKRSARGILRKEVIQPQVPLRLPCYDFTPVTEPTVVGCLHCWLAHHLRVDPIPMV
jgi:hypothetical protein